MGLGGINIPSLLIILAIVALVFGTKRLRGIGGDLGGAIKGFKKALGDDTKENDDVINNADKESSHAKSESDEK